MATAWTPERTAEVERLFHEGLTYQQIAKKVGRVSKHSVRYKLRSMGLGRHRSFTRREPQQIDQVCMPKNNPVQYHFEEGQKVELRKSDMAENHCAWKNKPQVFTFLRTIDGKVRLHLFQHRSGYKESFTDQQIGEAMR